MQAALRTTHKSIITVMAIFEVCIQVRQTGYDQQNAQFFRKVLNTDRKILHLSHIRHFPRPMIFYLPRVSDQSFTCSTVRFLSPIFICHVQCTTETINESKQNRLVIAPCFTKSELCCLNLFEELRRSQLRISLLGICVNC